MPRAQANATHVAAHEAAQESLAAGGTALRAVLSGFFAASGADPGALFGPTCLLVGGVGVGARAFDGRPLQPGAEGRRPRGFTEGEPIPSAQVAIPGSIWAASVAAGYLTGASLAACVRPGVSVARKQGAQRRAQLLDIIGSWGPRAFLEPSVRHSWLTEFGAVEGGTVQPRDLEPRGDLDAAADGASVLVPPWSLAGSGAAVVAAGDPGVEHGIVAVDTAGTFVGLSFRILPTSLTLADWEVKVPLLAHPVRRGVTRVAPGTRLACTFQLSLERAGATVVCVAAGPEGHQARLYRNPQTREVSAL